MFVLQLVYVFRVDWARKAQRAHNLCLKKSRRGKSEKQTTTISLVVLTGSELSKLESVTSGEMADTENTLQQTTMMAAAAATTVSSTSKPSLKRKMAKKALLFAMILLLFVGSILVKDLYEIRTSNLTFMHRRMFSNWTFLGEHLHHHKNATRAD